MEKSEEGLKREALEMGWIPPERYKGDPEKFIEAEDFVERGKNFIPILKKNNEKLMGQMGQIKGELDQTKQALGEALDSLREFKKFHEESAKNAYARARRELLAQKSTAMREEDFDKTIQIDDAIHQMDQQMAAATKAEEEKGKKKGKEGDGGQKLDPAMQQWIGENASWYGVDQARTAYANAIALKVREENPTTIGLEFLNLVKEEVEDKFGGGRKGRGKKIEEEEDADEEEEDGGRRVGKVDGGRQASSFGGGGKGRGGKLTYDRLTPEAKKICDRYSAQLVGPNKAYKTEDEWRKAYCASVEGE